MERRGRKPLALRHLDKLQGSAHAKQRMAILLKTLEGACTIPEACRELGIGESRFHELREQWLQEALELLEPRPLGRPRRVEEEATTKALRARVESLQRELALSDLRRDVQSVLAAAPAIAAAKKGARRS
jgi:Helix-turn-helix domain